MLLAFPSALLLVWQQHQIPASVQWLLLLGSICVLLPAALLLSTWLVLCLKLETLVVLLPGMERTTHVYGWREAWGRLVLNVGIFVCLVVGLIAALYLLWR